jgi:tRNA(fMet)-specific endonuclease VapC
VTRFLLDSNAITDLVRHPSGAVAQRIEAAGEDEVCTSVIVAAEVRYAVAKRGSAELRARCEAALGVLEVVPFASPADAVYARVRAALESTGLLIGANDMFIAAHALALGCTIVTDNEREFARVAGLKCVNWSRGR